MFIDFLLKYWKIILCFLLVITSLVLALVRKKSVSDILGWIHIACIMAVKEAETYIGAGSGELKLIRAINFVNEYLKKVFPNLDVSVYKDLIVQTIESILSTPQKKGD